MAQSDTITGESTEIAERRGHRTPRAPRYQPVSPALAARLRRFLRRSFDCHGFGQISRALKEATTGWSLPMLWLLLAATPTSAADLRSQVVWVDVIFAPTGEVQCSRVPPHVPNAFAAAAIDAVAGRSYADVLKSANVRDWSPTYGDSSHVAALHRLPDPARSVSGLIAVGFEEVDNQPGRFELTGMELIGEADPSVVKLDVSYDAVLDAAGAVTSAAPKEEAPTALESIARAALDQATFDSMSGEDALRNTEVTVTLLLQDAEAGGLDVAIGPFRKGPSIRTAHAPVYPRRPQMRGVSGWVDVAYDTDASGAVTNARVACSSPERKFDRAALQATKKFLYEPERVNGTAVASEGLHNRMTFYVSPN